MRTNFFSTNTNIKTEKENKVLLLLHGASSFRYNIRKKKLRQLNKKPKELKKRNGFRYLRKKNTTVFASDALF
jgi:hypothetical protein